MEQQQALVAMTSRRDSRTLMQVALGEKPADLVIKNVRLVNVYSGEIIDNSWIACTGEWIAAVGCGADFPTANKVIDGAGKTVIPGFIDAHTHLGWYFSPHQFLPYAMAGGTTTIVTESMEIFSIMGLEGLPPFFDSLKDQPIKLLASLPAGISISRQNHELSPEIIRELLQRPEVLGMGEVYWQALLQNPETILPNLEETLRSGKTLEGHSAGARGARLAAYTACGFTSCHEAIDINQVMDRLRLGYYVMIREGGVRRDLEAISPLHKREIDTRRLILVTDGIGPADLLEKGYMEYLVQKAINCGWNPVTAVQMATINPAERFGLGAVIGGIAPGRQADLMIIPDPQTISPQTVISRGEVIVEDKRLLVTSRIHNYPESCRQTIHLPRPLSANDFKVPGPAAGLVKVRVIDQITDLVTKEVQLELSAANGAVAADPTHNIIKVAAIDRTFTPGKCFVGFIRGFGLQCGALACSTAWDSSDIIVVGADENDMALAVNRVAELNGGYAAVADGELQAEIPMPIFGLISTAPVVDLADQLAGFKKAALLLGSRSADPLLTLSTLTGSAIPYLRICEEGLVDLKANRTLPLFVE